MAVALDRFWLSRGMMAQGQLACVAALSLPGAEQHEQLCAEAMLISGRLLSYRGLDIEAIAQLQQCVSLAREGELTQCLADALSRMGYAYLSINDRTTARACLEEAYALSKARQDDFTSGGTAATSLAELERLEGNIDAARHLYGRELRHVRACGDRLSTMIGLNNLSMIAVVQRDHATAREMLLESLAISDELGSRRGRLVVMEVCTGLAASLEQWPLTPRFDGAADIHTVQMGRRRDAPDAALLAPWVEQAKNALGPVEYDRALAAGRGLSYEQAVSEMSNWLLR